MEAEHSVTRSALKFISGENAHICRLCFTSTENEEVSIEDCVRVQSTYFDKSMLISEMFHDLCVPVELLLPQVLCKSCVTATISCYLFKKLSQYSTEKWTEALGTLENTLSKTDSINPDIKTAYFIVNNDNKLILTSRKTVRLKSKRQVITKIKEIISNRRRHMKKKETVVCPECNKHCSSNIELTKHMKVHKDGKTRIPCPQCGKLFSTEMQLEDHAERLHYAKNIHCTQCSKMFSTVKMLKRHENLQHVATICKLCFIQFPSRIALSAHLNKHAFNKCLNCNKEFLNKMTFKLHLKICGQPDRRKLVFFCDICKKGYARKNSLRSHMKTDHGFGQVFTCRWCNKKYDAISRLRNHIVKHTRERNFYCEHCGGKFVTQAALVYHIRLHTGEKPFPCDLCNESFLSASRRMEHKRRKHFEPTKECPVCHMKYVTGHQLKKHLQRHYNPQSKLYVPQEPMTMLSEKAVVGIKNEPDYFY